MYLLFAIIVALIGLWILPRNIFEIPFSQFTLKIVFGASLAGGAYICAMMLFFQSLEHDRIWPWRWTWPYFGNLVIRCLLIAFIVWCGAWFIDEKKLDGFWFFLAIGCVSIGVIYAMFSSDVEHFSEKKEKGDARDE